MSIMISHTATESYLAQAWQDLLHEAFDLQRDSIWFSSDPDAFDAGPFAAQIESKIRQSSVVISIQTPVSRFRPWTIWEAGIARGLERPLFVIVYDSPQVPRGRGIFNRLGTPLDALQQIPGTDAEKIRGVLDNLSKKIDRAFVSTRLEESLRKYIKSVSCHQRCWISEKRIFDKRVELVLTLEERDQIIQQPILPDTVKIRNVDGSARIFGLDVPETSWREFTANLASLDLESPWAGSAERWARGLGRTINCALRGRLISEAEGLPLYFDPQEKKTYRPSVSSQKDQGSETIFTLSFTLIPPELVVSPTSAAGILVQHLDLCRMWRWGILEDPDISDFFRNVNFYTKKRASEVICSFLGKIFSVRTEFWNRGLERDAIRDALDKSDLGALDEILQRYYIAMRALDPNDEGTFPDPMPDYEFLKKVYCDLLKVNKDYYLLVHRALGRELAGLRESIL
jgi:hypothetical protein